MGNMSYYEEDIAADDEISGEDEEELLEEVRPVVSKPTPGCGHIAQCVGMNVLVWGGYKAEEGIDERYLPAKELWVYNLQLENWTCLKTNGEIPPGMSGCSSCLYEDSLFVFGGHSYHGNTNTVYKLDLKTLTWTHLTALSDLMSPRDKASIWCYNHKIYVFGGFGVPLKGYTNNYGQFDLDPSLEGTSIRNRGWNNQLLIFDMKEETCSNPKSHGPVPHPRAAHASARIGDNVYVFGGRYLYDRLNDLHCLNLPSLTWSGELAVSSNIPCGRSWHTLTTVSDSQIFLYGGFTMDQVPLSDAWILDVNKTQWTELKVSNSKPRLWHCACLSQEEDIVIYGGCTNNILDMSVPTTQSNEILCFRLQPKRLWRLCFDFVFLMRERTQDSWDMLPYNIKNMLDRKMKLKCVCTDDNIPSENKSQPNHTSNCAVS